MKLKLLRYIETMPSADYQAVVSDLAKDPDAAVAASATNVLKKLGRQ